MNDISDHQKKKIRIGVLGDIGVGKSHFINSFMVSTEESSVNQSAFYKRCEKMIRQSPFILDFYEFNTKNDKYISFVQKCNVMLIIIDLNNRNSFDNLNDCWLQFLKNDCYYSNDVFILGNYLDKSSAPITSTEEIKEMIKYSEIPDSNYIEVGNKTNEELNILIDELIFQQHKDEIKNAKEEDNQGASFKVDKCVIY